MNGRRWLAHNAPCIAPEQKPPLDFSRIFQLCLRFQSDLVPSCRRARAPSILQMIELHGSQAHAKPEIATSRFLMHARDSKKISGMDTNQPTPSNEVMNGDEAAVFLQMPKSTLLKLCSEGQLPGVKVGRQWRFHRDALEKWKSDRAGTAEEMPSEHAASGGSGPLDFQQDLGKAEARIQKSIPPVVEEVVGSVGGDDFGDTGDVVELDTLSEGVGEVRELEETPEPESDYKPGRRGAADRSASALELMAQISDKSHGRRGKAGRAKIPTAPSKTPLKPAAEPARDSRPDDGAVEVSRPYNRQAAAAPVPRTPKRGGSGGGALQAIKKIAYWAVVLVVLALAGLGVKSMLVPVPTIPVASTDSATPDVPALPEFQVVYRHNEEENIKQDNLAVPTPPPTEPAAPTAAVTTSTPMETVALQAPPAPPTTPQAPAAAQEGGQQPAVPITTAPPVNRGLEAINRILPVLFELSGTTITSNNNEIRITFQEGIFTSGITVGDSGRAQLGRVAEFLKANAPDFWVIIEGQTDSKAVRVGSQFRDNYTLGLRRAVAATEVMRSDSQFPTDRLLASSAGGMTPPFPENETGSAARNRTVILRLVPRIVD
jgi:excisionase family DNA binding protein